MIDHETLGAHIRNILTPYANIIQLLEDIHENNDERMKEFLLTKIDPKKLQKNLNHFIEVSKLKEVEDINWRATELCEKYYKEIENS
jgi:hypothetical protein